MKMMMKKIQLRLKDKSRYCKKLTSNFTKMNFFRTIPFVIIIILALLVMLIAGGIGLIATGFMNVAILLDQEAGNIRDGK